MSRRVAGGGPTEVPPIPFMDLPDGSGCGSNPPTPGQQRLLNQVVRYYHRRYAHSLRPSQFMMRLGLSDPALVTEFKIGFCDRTLCHRLPDGRTAEGGAIRGELMRLRVLRPSGHERFRGSLVIPVLDQQGNVRDIFGRKVLSHQRIETSLDISLFDPPRGVFNLSGLQHQQEIVLCSGIFDAMTFWSQGVQNATTTLGLKGLTSEHLAVFERLGIRRVVIAFERTKPADDDARFVAQALDAIGIECRRVDLPRDLDVNTYARLRRQTKATLAELVQRSKPFRQDYVQVTRSWVCARAESPSA